MIADYNYKAQLTDNELIKTEYGLLRNKTHRLRLDKIDSYSYEGKRLPLLAIASAFFAFFGFAGEDNRLYIAAFIVLLSFLFLKIESLTVRTPSKSIHLTGRRSKSIGKKLQNILNESIEMYEDTSSDADEDQEEYNERPYE